MSVPIVTTPSRTHLVVERSRRTYSNGLSVVTVCGKFLVDYPETPNFVGTHESGDLAASITCKNCRRTMTPSKVVFADESTAVVGAGQAVLPAGAAIVPDSPTVEVRWNGDLWEVHINFSDPEQEPQVFMNGYEAEVTV